MNSWADLNCRTVRRDPPEFFDLLVGKSDATDGPILPTMKGADPAESVSNSVDHDVKTGGDPALGSACVVIVRRIGNVQRKMKAALRIPPVDLVNTFGRFHVALLLLRAHRVASQCYSISLDLLAVAKDRQFLAVFSATIRSIVVPAGNG